MGYFDFRNLCSFRNFRTCISCGFCVYADFILYYKSQSNRARTFLFSSWYLSQGFSA